MQNSDLILDPVACGVMRFNEKEKAYAPCDGARVMVRLPIGSLSKPFHNGQFLEVCACDKCGLLYVPKVEE